MNKRGRYPLFPPAARLILKHSQFPQPDRNRLLTFKVKG